MSTLKVGGIRGVSASSDAITVANDGTCTANITNNLSNRNKIINGGMTVSQRNGTTVVTGVNTTGYRIDRWTHQIDSINSVFSVSQSTDTPDEFGNSYKIDVTTADTSLAAAHAHFFRQKIEGQNLQDFAKGTSAAKQFAVSFYVKTNKTGIYTVELYDIDNNRAISKTFTVADSNWNRYTLIYPADTTGAFGNDNGNSLVLQFWLSAGSNYTSGTLNTSAWAAATQANRVSSSNVNLGDNTSNEWYLTGVQLEVGSVATDFEHRSFAQELALCQRYYYRAHVGSDGAERPIALGVYENNSTVTTTLRFHDMRANPTLIADSGNDKFVIRRQSGSDGFTSFTLRYSRVNTAEIVGSGTMSGTAGVAGFLRSAGNGAAFLDFSAEL